MSDIVFYILLLIVGIVLIPFVFWVDKKNSKLTYYQQHPEKLKKPWHKRWWLYLVAVILVAGSIGNLADPETYQSHKPKQTRLASDKEMQKEYKKTVKENSINHTQNLPDQKINQTKATKGKFYWTAKDNKKVRLFVSDKKITAIKYVTGDDYENPSSCQIILSKILDDNNLKYGDDKQSGDDTLLDNDSRYNIYSPKYKKWYNVQFTAGYKKDDAVSSFSIYPNKSSEAE